LNVLIDLNYQIKIIDFGLAKEFDVNEEKKLRGNCGSPKYKAPEVLERGSHYNEKCDMWSIGIMIYKILTGVEPFDLEFTVKEKYIQDLNKLIFSGVYPLERKLF
jgi:serine/threonine protein kinase